MPFNFEHLKVTSVSGFPRQMTTESKKKCTADSVEGLLKAYFSYRQEGGRTNDNICWVEIPSEELTGEELASIQDIATSHKADIVFLRHSENKKTTKKRDEFIASFIEAGSSFELFVGKGLNLKAIQRYFPENTIHSHANCTITTFQPLSLLSEKSLKFVRHPSHPGFLGFLMRNFGASAQGTMGWFSVTLLLLLGILLLGAFTPLSGLLIAGSSLSVFGLFVIGMKVMALVTAAFTVGMGVKAVVTDYRSYKNASQDKDYFWRPYLREKFIYEFVRWTDSPGNVAKLAIGLILFLAVVTILICAGPGGLVIPGISAGITLVTGAFATSTLFGGSFFFTAFFLGAGVMATYALLCQVIDTIVEFFGSIKNHDGIDLQELSEEDRKRIVQEMTSEPEEVASNFASEDVDPEIHTLSRGDEDISQERSQILNDSPKTLEMGKDIGKPEEFKPVFSNKSKGASPWPDNEDSNEETYARSSDSIEDDQDKVVPSPNKNQNDYESEGDSANSDSEDEEEKRSTSSRSLSKSNHS